MRHATIAFAVLVLLSSCLSIEQNIDLKSDGSGILTLNYRLSEDFAGFGSLGDDESTFPIPVEKQSFMQGADAVEGIRFRSYSSKLKDGVRHIKGKVSFSDTAALSSFLFGETGSISFTESGDVGKLVITYDVQGVAGMTQDAEDMIKAFFNSETVIFRINTPKTVFSVSDGVFVGKEASIAYKVPDFAVRQSFSWEVTWK